jgi:hypothetical protein
MELDKSQFDVSLLPTLLSANPELDWREVKLDHAAGSGGLQLAELSPSVALPLLQAYQRILHILPATQEQRAAALIASGLHSAIQIAGIPRHQFERHWAALFPGEESLGQSVYRAALSRRSELLHRHLNQIQANEPHYRAARFK